MGAIWSRPAVAWEIFYQVLSRSRDDLIPVMTHPCDGQYECLTALRKQRSVGVVSINLRGTGILVGNAQLQYQDRMTASQIDRLAQKIIILSGSEVRESGRRELPATAFLVDLLSANRKRDYQIINAWLDDPYGSHLDDRAAAFVYYPLSAASDREEHIPWWVIIAGGEPLAICNLETNIFISGDGQRLDLATEKQAALDAIARMALKHEFDQVVENTRRLLTMNTEWTERYADYATEISNQIPYIENIRRTFHEWQPLLLYLNVSNAKKAQQHLIFELRYLGQTVAHLCFKKALLLDTAKYDALNLRDFGCTAEAHSEPWDSPAAAAFRTFFKSRAPQRNTKGKRNKEHQVESLLLTEFSKATDKLLYHIQPVRVAKLRFPMPTPLGASRHDRLKYSGPNGGGIDLFVRLGTGRGAKLAILELKDKNEVREPPKDALRQAVAYAVFIRELLRSASGPAWWRLFGFGGNIPERLKLIAACTMPYEAGADDRSFAGMELAAGDDVIQLHYIYFAEEQNVIRKIITSIDQCATGERTAP